MIRDESGISHVDSSTDNRRIDERDVGRIISARSVRLFLFGDTPSRAPEMRTGTRPRCHSSANTESSPDTYGIIAARRSFYNSPRIPDNTERDTYFPARDAARLAAPAEIHRRHSRVLHRHSSRTRQDKTEILQLPHSLDREPLDDPHARRAKAPASRRDVQSPRFRVSLRSLPSFPPSPLLVARMRHLELAETSGGDISRIREEFYSSGENSHAATCSPRVEELVGFADRECSLASFEVDAKSRWEVSKSFRPPLCSYFCRHPKFVSQISRPALAGASSTVKSCAYETSNKGRRPASVRFREKGKRI